MHCTCVPFSDGTIRRIDGFETDACRRDSIRINPVNPSIRIGGAGGAQGGGARAALTLAPQPAECQQGREAGACLHQLKDQAEEDVDQ